MMHNFYEIVERLELSRTKYSTFLRPTKTHLICSSAVEKPLAHFSKIDSDTRVS